MILIHCINNVRIEKKIILKDKYLELTVNKNT